ncbi:MAG: signal peptidase II [Lachnospiraceae bacterium]|nr:signal peptidase II [Robinsoniella sp.]MDY3765380.1 signal peptidase II [Lachnospiraceae bacterium]
MKTTIRQHRAGIAFLSCSLLILLDQLTKWLAARFLKGGSDLVVIPNVFELHYLENVGVAFGILKNRQWLPITFAAIIAVGFFVAYCKTSLKKQFLPLRISMIGIISGAIGNMIDRIWHGYVIDFAYISLIDFPVFNLADCYIVLSIILLAILVLFVYHEEELQDAFIHKKTHTSK